MEEVFMSACVTVRAAAGLPLHYNQPFLNFIYKQQQQSSTSSSTKRLSVKSVVASVVVTGATQIAQWRDASVCVPTTASSVEIELWNAFQQHDIFIGSVKLRLTKRPSEPGTDYKISTRSSRSNRM
jgi:hypothetical protein